MSDLKEAAQALIEALEYEANHPYTIARTMDWEELRNLKKALKPSKEECAVVLEEFITQDYHAEFPRDVAHLQATIEYLRED